MNVVSTMKAIPQPVFRRGASRRAAVIRVLFCAAAVLAMSAGVVPARAFTPGSPEVVGMVESGLKYLENTKQHDEMGGDALIGMTLVKNGYDESHHRVARAVVRVTRTPLKDQNNYSVGLGLLFLCELDTKKYAKNIQTYLAELYRRQRDFGSWTYDGSGSGDTSQSQYGVLALWMAHRHGFDEQEIEQRLARACNWLIRTQDPAGGWGYHGRDPSTFNRLTQSGIRLSTTAAGLGSLYICGSVLGLGAAVDESAPLPGDLPALVPVVERQAAKARTQAIDLMHYNRTQRDGNRWVHAHYKIEQELWPYYCMYALERYYSFREIAEGRKDDSPFWYNDGVGWLMLQQGSDGAFKVGQKLNSGTDAATAFAILFLIRSTKKSLGGLNEGTLRGGIGLPSNESKMALYGGRIVSADVSKSLSDLLGALEDQETTELTDLIRFSRDLEIVVDDPDAYLTQIEELRRMASHTSYEVRHVAVRALAKTRDMDNAPTLIFALSDPDPRVALEAHEGLKFLSRKFEGFEMEADASPAQRSAAILKWKEWYQSIRPNARLLD